MTRTWPHIHLVSRSGMSSAEFLLPVHARTATALLSARWYCDDIVMTECKHQTRVCASFLDRPRKADVPCKMNDSRIQPSTELSGCLHGGQLQDAVAWALSDDTINARRVIRTEQGAGRVIANKSHSTDRHIKLGWSNRFAVQSFYVDLLRVCVSNELQCVSLLVLFTALRQQLAAAFHTML
jgi:hypothetical protein